MTVKPERRFQLVLIKPSHYDDDGYVVTWWRSLIPSNSLAVVYSLAADAAERNALGDDVAVDITAIDETNTHVDVADIIRRFRRNGLGMVGLVGVQSNQFPRALDIARPLRAAAIPVVIGGFHVSGCLAMLPELEPGMGEALDLGVSLFAGEAEGRFDDVLRDAMHGRLKPIYNYLNDLPGIEHEPVPILPKDVLRRTLQHHASFDAGRGCPYQCSFCTIINVQGRKSRRRSPDDIETVVRRHAELGITHFFITDDNFARNKDWEPIFDRLIELRERDKFKLRLVIQVDTLCHKLTNFIDKAARAGVTRVFIGLENINPTNLMAAKKRQNKITEYRQMLLAWKAAGVVTYAGYILGFPADTPESIRQDIEIIKKELPLDILEFFCLTPLPGSEDHKVLWQQGAAMDPDLNKYDLEHVVADHAKMSREEWQQIYRDAWDLYYTPEHVETLLRRAYVKHVGIYRLAALVFFFSKFVAFENLHPLQGGLLRLKRRLDRRPELPVEPVWAFYPKLIRDNAVKFTRMAKHWKMVSRSRKLVRYDPDREHYSDPALVPVTEDGLDSLEMFTHNDGAREAVSHARKVARITQVDVLAPATPAE
jgi:hypothetical protein